MRRAEPSAPIVRHEHPHLRLQEMRALGVGWPQKPSGPSRSELDSCCKAACTSWAACYNSMYTSWLIKRRVEKGQSGRNSRKPAGIVGSFKDGLRYGRAHHERPHVWPRGPESFHCGTGEAVVRGPAFNL